MKVRAAPRALELLRSARCGTQASLRPMAGMNPVTLPPSHAVCHSRAVKGIACSRRSIICCCCALATRSSPFFCAATAQYGFAGEPFFLSSALTDFEITPYFFAMSGASKFSQFFINSLCSRSNSMRPSKVRWPFLSVKLLRCSGSIRVVSSHVLSCASSARASSPVAAGAPAGPSVKTMSPGPSVIS